jgi:hypothetical protein
MKCHEAPPLLVLFFLELLAITDKWIWYSIFFWEGQLASLGHQRTALRVLSAELQKDSSLCQASPLKDPKVLYAEISDANLKIQGGGG